MAGGLFFAGRRKGRCRKRLYKNPDHETPALKESPDARAQALSCT